MTLLEIPMLIMAYLNTQPTIFVPMLIFTRRFLNTYVDSHLTEITMRLFG
jgi:hypothetical protein